MADEQELARVEALCQQIYQGADAAERVQAENQLAEFCCGTSPDCLQRCRLLLDRSQNSYVQLLAATTLNKLVSKHPGSPQLAAAIRNAELHLVLPVAKTEKRCICDPGFGAAFCTTYQIGLV
ncbi:hypothetical protein MRX96_041537 [Rhipicephalus microplus]